MNAPKSLLELSESRATFKKLFQIAYSLKEPVLPLSRIMHWYAVSSTLEMTNPELDNTSTLVFGGYFYNFSTPDISEVELKSAIEMAKTMNANTILVPTVRDDVDERAFEVNGFVKIPWFVESSFDINNGVEASLKQRIGNKDARQLLRTHAKAQEVSVFKWYNHQELKENPSLAEIAVSLQDQNIKKHNHTVNLYPIEVVREILNSNLSEKFKIGIRYLKSTNQPIQAVLCLSDPDSSHLHLLVQGADYSSLITGQNFYNALYIDVYLMAESEGYKKLFLGRGNHILKKKLGANSFRILNNWIKTSDSIVEGQLHEVRRRMSETYSEIAGSLASG